MTIGYQELNADTLKIKTTSNPTDPNTLAQGAHTDHTIEVSWSESAGWSQPELKPWAPLSIDPSASVLHYSVTCFEGMKAYKSEDGKSVQMFRPRDNIARLNDSAARICLPQLDADQVIKLLEVFLKVEERFIEPGHYIYLRPLLMGTEPNLGFRTSREAKFIIMATLFPVLNSKPLKLFCSPPTAIRAWPGGFGYAKLGANYAPTLPANTECVKAGFSAVLWLLGENGIVTEAGTSNFFAVVKNAETGRDEILTCPLSTGVILPGVTRRSVLEVLRNEFEGQEVDVVEREFSIGELEKAEAEGRLVEAFSVGTAYFVAPVETIKIPTGKDLSVPLGKETIFGKYSTVAKSKLGDIMWGRVDHPWGHRIPL
ncbi:branched-chain-amino-acid aminotransferase, cytosolic [Trichomonascus vanleenenianus]|uniref:branched-chain-amino-acid aminotransferase, cytosolic n=1 Tax=Trichomonascus vanleenenianus TaxID=2268995 RepID=UPI003ECBA180